MPETRAVIHEGWAVCPRCRKKLARVHYGAVCRGVELYCKNCREGRLLELK